MTDTTAKDAAWIGSRAYSKWILSIYDLGVHGFSNAFIWRCPTWLIQTLYDQHVSVNHLEIGVGTGYLLDMAHFPTATPNITLVDLNPNCLETTSKRIARYYPVSIAANALEPLSLPPASFASIGINYVLHCLPGTMADKAKVFQHHKLLLAPGGVLFGTTILSQGVKRGLVAKAMMRLYNKLGVFSNKDDDLDVLQHILRANFHSYSVHVSGCVALFVGHV